MPTAQKRHEHTPALCNCMGTPVFHLLNRKLRHLLANNRAGIQQKKTMDRE